MSEAAVEQRIILNLHLLAASLCCEHVSGRLHVWGLRVPKRRGREALAQKLLLTLKVSLTHRITLNLSPHTAAGETIRGEEIT